jgi:hypothetical protein
MEAKGYINATAAAALLRMVVSTIHRLCAENRLEHIRIGGQPDGHMARTYIRRDRLKHFLGADAAKLLKV